MAKSDPHQESLIRSRIVGHGDVEVKDLLANPLNFRRHPGPQMDALRGSMKELGWLKTILINKTTGHILDGHARVEEAMRQGMTTIPATIVELSEADERLALAVLDPITEMAYRDTETLQALLADISTDDPGLLALLMSLDVNQSADDPKDHWRGLPDFENDEIKTFKDVVVHFDQKEDLEAFIRLTGITITGATKSVYFPRREKADLKSQVYDDPSRS